MLFEQDLATFSNRLAMISVVSNNSRERAAKLILRNFSCSGQTDLTDWMTAAEQGPTSLGTSEEAGRDMKALSFIHRGRAITPAETLMRLASAFSIARPWVA